MSEHSTAEEKTLHLPFFIFEALSVIVVLYYLVTSVFHFFHWISGGHLSALLGFFIESGIIAFPFSVPFALNFVARCKKHGIVISSVVDVTKAFNILFLFFASIIISGFLRIPGYPALLSVILHSVGVFCIPWFFVAIWIWESKNNKRISISIVENQIRLTLRGTSRKEVFPTNL